MGRRRVRRRTEGGRRTSGAIVFRVEHHKTKRKGVVRLDKVGAVFWAVAGTEPTSPYFESTDGSEVRSWLETQLGKTTESDRLEWQPVIKVEVSEEYGSRRDDEGDERDESVQIEIERYFIALTKDGREWRKLDWHECDDESGTAIADNDRAAQSHFYGKGPKHEDFNEATRDSWRRDEKPFVLPHHEKGGASIVNYTPELWEGLVSICDQIKGVRRVIGKMLGSKTGLDLIAKHGAEKMPLRITATASGS